MCVTHSTCEAEYLGQLISAINIVWLQGLLKEIKINRVTTGEPLKLYTNNQGAIDTANQDHYQKWMKHVALHYHYVRDLVKKKQVELIYKPSQEIIADGLTKGLGLGKFNEFFSIFGLRSTTELHKSIRKKLGVIGVA